MLSKKHKFFCLRIEKNASKSIRACLKPRCNHIDSVLTGMRHIKYNLDNYYKFTFVRNPYKRIVSYYFHLHKRNDFYFDQIEYPFKSKQSFYEFVKMFEPRSVRRYILQYDYLIDDNEFINFDYIGRVENIKQDISNIQDRLKVKFAKLPHKNRSVFIDYKSLYNEDSYNLVSKKWKKDIDFFGYSF